VDAADYVIWRKALGQQLSPFAGADGSGNGVVDQADYQVWRANFGRPLPASGAALLPPDAGSDVDRAAASADTVENQSQPAANPRSHIALVAAAPSSPPDIRGDISLPGGQLSSLARAAAASDDALLAWIIRATTR
jgi:hypothetical protein